MLGGKMGRELTLRRALRDVDGDYDVMMIDCPPSLGPADGQRARRRRPRAAQRRGAVLRAAGRRAGARGHRAGPRQPEPRPGVAGRAVQHRRHAHRATRARRRRRCSEHVGEQAVRARRSASRSPTPSRPSGRSRSSTTGPTSARTTSRSPTSCSRRLGLDDARARLGALAVVGLSDARLRARRTSAPGGSNGARRTSAQPSVSRAAPRRPRRSARSASRRARSGRRRRSSRPSAPSSLRPLDQLHRARVEVRAARLVEAVARPRATRSQSPRARPSMSSEACATLKTASASGTSAGSAARACAVRTASAGTTSDGLQARRAARSASAVAVGADHEPAQQRRGDVVGMALELGRAARAGRRRARTCGRPP